MKSRITIGADFLGSDPRLVGMSEKFEFQDGKKGARIGTTLEVLLPHAGFEKIRVTTPEMAFPIAPEEIDARNTRFDPIKIQFEGFTATPYVDKTGNISYSGKATKALFPGFKKEGV